MKRYEPAWKCCPEGKDMDEAADGEWVKFSDMIELVELMTLDMNEYIPPEVYDLLRWNDEKTSAEGTRKGMARPNDPGGGDDRHEPVPQ
jgi:hypothetical protein